MKLSNNSFFVILIFAFFKFRNIDRSTFRCSKFFFSKFFVDPNLFFLNSTNTQNTYLINNLVNSKFLEF